MEKEDSIELREWCSLSSLPAKARETSERGVSIRSHKAERKGIRFAAPPICVHTCVHTSLLRVTVTPSNEDSSAVSREFFGTANRKFSFG